MQNEQLTLKENRPNDAETKILEFRKKNIKLYNNIQIELLARKYGSREEIDRRYEEIDELDSREYAEAFHQVVGERMSADEGFQYRENFSSESLSEDIARKIDYMHALEEALLLDANQKQKQSNSNLFLIWHKKYGRKLIAIIHKNPQILFQFEESKDKNPEAERILLEKIEVELYQ